MSITPLPDSDQLLRGNFAVYAALLNASGLPTGERHLGNCSAIQLTPTIEKVTKETRMTSDRGVYKEGVRSKQMSISLTLDEFSMENLALFGLAELTTYGQTSGSLSDYELTDDSEQGLWYPCGKRDLSSVTVDDDTVLATLTEDYTVDAASGRIYIVPGGGIQDGSTVTVSASYAANSRKVARLLNNTTARHYLRLVGDPSDGPTHEIELWKVHLLPAGGLDLITDEFTSLPMTGTVFLDSTNHASAPWGHIIEKTAA